MMRLGKQVAIGGSILMIAVGIFTVSAFTSSPKDIPGDKPKTQAIKTVSDVKGAYSPPQENIVTQPSTTTPVPQKPGIQAIPSKNVSLPPMSEADKAAIQRAKDQIAAQEERVRVARCDALRLQYDSNVANENARYIRALAAIDSDYLGRGMGYSGAYPAAKEQENTRHESNINVIETQLANDIIANGCT